MNEEIIVFEVLNSIDVSGKIKTKNGLKYLSWASAWAEVKKQFPGATYEIKQQVMDEFGNTRFWHDDGKTGWVEVEVTINGLTIGEVLAIMDFKNKSIPAADITSTDANKSLKRCLVKACAMHGMGMYIYEGEDIPEELKMVNEIIEEIREIVDKKVKLSDEAKKKVANACKTAERNAFPDMDEELITGNYKNISDYDILADLKKRLLVIKK